MPGLLNKIFYKLPQKNVRFKKKLMVYYFSVSAVVNLLKRAWGKCLQYLPS